jgi:beta-glucanase (GH16 family)
VPLVPVIGGPYRLVRNWDFVNGIRDVDALRREFHTRYLYDDGRLDHLNDEWSRYRDHGNHVFTPHGLDLVARSPSGRLEPGHIESGMLRSRWSGRHGVFEIRMTAPRGAGLWPAFWLNPENGGWPPEIDVVEIVNHSPGATRRSYHFLHGAGQRSARVLASRLDAAGAYASPSDFAERSHAFAVEWLPGRVRHFVDGVLVADRDMAWRHDDGRDAGAAHVLVNLAVGGRWPGAPTAESLPARLSIQHIRVWQA